mmetsp:Transcript_6797/g.20637  ORF Transcript_6797/g.20637 Transcript_6797/m.20637 type:complete len:146 (-) Transcript_6797:2202-2639(-)
MNMVQAPSFVPGGGVASGDTAGSRAEGVMSGAPTHPVQGGFMGASMGMPMMHPSAMTMMQPFYTATAPTDDQPVYVNAKQYNRILKRREARKKKYGEDEMQMGRTRRKAYIHESRHQHAMKRQRGAGGRFLSRAEREGESNKDDK